MQTIYNSLSHDYQAAIQELQSLTGKEYTSINIVGGGSQDMYLNQMTANATQLPVFAGPTEGTALGNMMVQMMPCRGVQRPCGCTRLHQKVVHYFGM